MKTSKLTQIVQYAVVALLSLSVMGSAIGCAGGGLGGDDDSTKARQIRDSKALEDRYKLVVGTYEGILVTKDRNVEATLFLYIENVKDGTHSDGEVKERPELRGRFKMKDWVSDTDAAVMTGSYDLSGNISLVGGSTTSSTGAGVKNTLTMRGTIFDGRIRAEALRSGGIWGQFDGIRTSTESTAPAGGEDADFRDRLRRAYKAVEGRYVATMIKPNGDPVKAEIVLTMNPGSAAVTPTLFGYFSRLDMAESGAGRYSLAVDYNDFDGTISMRSVTPDKLPGSGFLVIDGTLINQEMNVMVSNKDGSLGRFRTRKQ